ARSAVLMFFKKVTGSPLDFCQACEIRSPHLTFDSGPIWTMRSEKYLLTRGPFATASGMPRGPSSFGMGFAILSLSQRSSEFRRALAPSGSCDNAYHCLSKSGVPGSAVRPSSRPYLLRNCQADALGNELSP